MATASGVLARYGEVFLKKGRRRYFLDALAANLQRLLQRKRPDLKLTRPYGRFLVVPREPDARIEDATAVAELVASVFGVVWAGLVEVVNEPSPEAVHAATVAWAQGHRRRRHRTFKIITTRADKSFPGTSIDLNRSLGSAVLEALGDLTVDLEEPDLAVHVEIRQEAAYVYGEGVDGAGGLPVGSNGRALLLLSGGIDSPVAGWLTQKRGVAIDAITFLSPPYTGPQAREKVVQLATRLAGQQKSLRLWLVTLTPLQERFRDGAPGDKLVLLYRRSMVRIADAIAAAEGHQALVTGENLGQVASQTLPNLHCIGMVATRPVLRPLITFDKVEIIRVARRIGTYETSILPYDDCCSLFVPRHPELRGKPHHLEIIEADLEPGALEQTLREQAELLTIP